MEIRGEIHYYLSEQGRRDSLLKGGDGHFKQTMAGSINETDIEMFSVDASGLVFFDATTIPTTCWWWVCEPPTTKGRVVAHDNGEAQLHWDIVPSWEDLLSIAREVKDQNDEMQAKREQITEAFTNDPKARAIKIEQHHVIVDGEKFDVKHPLYVVAHNRWNQDQAELKQRNRATLADWIKQHGSTNQQQRLAAHLLPWNEAYQTATEYLYSPLQPFPLYERFSREEVCECQRDEYISKTCDIKFQSVDATELTADEWDQLSQIQAVVPDATFQLREHRAACFNVVGQKVRRGVIVKFTLGELGFKREFALGGTHDGR